VLETYQQAAQAALDAGLDVNAGHDLDLNNVQALCEQGRIMEVSIGHALTVEALEQGWNNVVKAYLAKLA
jgi:pyridoxine 5-phosphate synthase